MHKLKVAAYCRVSRFDVSQRSSLENQRAYYEEFIRGNPNWEYAGIYWEAGVSGTQTARRPRLQEMLADCRAGQVDLILTKSISRFSRNAAECIAMVRALKALGVNLYFEKEGIYTADTDSELMLTLYSSFAEEESRAISENIRWSVHQRFENGTYRYSRAPYGYRLEDGGLVVNPEEAAVIRNIFAGVLAGKGTQELARELNERKIPANTVKRDGSAGKWTASRLLGILKNPVYTGDVLLQKTWHGSDFRRRANYGEKAQYYLENHHEAIISREIFDLAAAASRDRGAEKNNFPEENRRNRNNPHSRKSCFSGMLFCGCCGSPMKRITQNTRTGKRFHWGCTGHIADKSACPMTREQEASVKNAFLTLLNKLVFCESLFARLLPEDAACAAFLKETAAAYRKCGKFSETLFTDTVDRVVIHTGTKAVFHLRYGLCFTEKLS